MKKFLKHLKWLMPVVLIGILALYHADKLFAQVKELSFIMGISQWLKQQWQVVLGIVVVGLLMAFFLYAKKWVKVLMYVLGLAVGGSMIWQAIDSGSALQISSERLHDKVVLSWEKPAGSSEEAVYAIEQGDSAYGLQSVGMTAEPMWIATQLENKPYYFKVTQYVNNTPQKSSEIVTVAYQPDGDLDGLSDEQESQYSTDAQNKDTDNDRLTDYEEIFVHKSNPLKEDTDEDTLSDYQEVLAGLNPSQKDTDNDGSSDDRSDTDGDGLSVTDEIGFSDPLLTDTDMDGLNDADEKSRQTDPRKPDTDGDGVLDGHEYANGTDPLKTDTDNDGMPDGDELVTVKIKYDAELSDDLAKPTVEYEVEAKKQDTFRLSPVTPESVFDMMKLKGYETRPFEFVSSETLARAATMTIALDDKIMVDDKLPAVYRVDKKSKQLVYVNGQEYSKTERRIEAKVEQSGTYVVLNQKDFEASYVEKTEKEPTPVVLTIDVSNSMSSNDSGLMRAKVAKEFINQMKPYQSPAAVVQFDSDAELLNDLTTDWSAVENSLDKINNNGGGTSGSSGLRKAVDALLKDDKYKNTPKMIVFMTDGQDGDGSSGEAVYQQVIKDAQANQIKIYTIGLGSVDKNKLQTIATSTQANYYHIDEIGKIQFAFDSIQIYTTKKQPEGVVIGEENATTQPVVVTDNDLVHFANAAYGEAITKDKLKDWQELSIDLPPMQDVSNFLSGFEYKVFKKDNNIVVAFSGTDFNDVDFVEHIIHWFFDFYTHPQDIRARLLINELQKQNHMNRQSNIYLTGHSLGGRLTLVANDLLNQNHFHVKSRTFNPLGVTSQSKNMLYTHAYSGDNLNYYIPGDPLDSLGIGALEKYKKEVQRLDDSNSAHSLNNFLIPGAIEDK